ncbi:hypothetical protein C8Q75DRAFT_79854 [Abortiporus biennis]|nr:hypothetical protein C8Q75DRAFT_79854 [Abortiporus biennis]
MTLSSHSRSVEIPATFLPGSLNLAGFAQARAPHVGLLIPKDVSCGTLVHIRVDRSTSPYWQFQSRTQRITGEMFITTLLRIHEGTDISEEKLEQVAREIDVPQNDEFGECLPWAMRCVTKLDELGLVKLVDHEQAIDKLRNEFEEFAERNKAYARRDKFPNVAVSKFCS